MFGLGTARLSGGEGMTIHRPANPEENIVSVTAPPSTCGGMFPTIVTQQREG
jgi:hypothetical protein